MRHASKSEHNESENREAHWQQPVFDVPPFFQSVATINCNVPMVHKLLHFINEEAAHRKIPAVIYALKKNLEGALQDHKENYRAKREQRYHDED